MRTGRDLLMAGIPEDKIDAIMPILERILDPGCKVGAVELIKNSHFKNEMEAQRVRIELTVAGLYPGEL